MTDVPFVPSPGGSTRLVLDCLEAGEADPPLVSSAATTAGELLAESSDL